MPVRACHISVSYTHLDVYKRQSLYYNIKILLQPFDREKAINSALKVAAFVVGLTLLCVSITTLPLYRCV